MRILTTEIFLKRSKEVHGDKFGYSKTVYTNSRSKVKIDCSKHGEFEQIAKSHLRGQGCGLCANNVGLTRLDFVKKAKKVHGKLYKYSKVEYKNNRTNVIITCAKHGDFTQLPVHHLKGSGCSKCNGDKNRLRCANTKQTFTTQAEVVHGKKYDYSKVEYKSNKDNICIICPEHGEFSQRPDHHCGGSGCPNCNTSKGENKTKKLLKERGVTFKQQHSFDGCRNTLPLPFDFYLPEHNICIEYNGKQHYEPVKYFGGEKTFKQQKKRDKIKSDYCKSNNIQLISIRYDECIETKIGAIALL